MYHYEKETSHLVILLKSRYKILKNWCKNKRSGTILEKQTNKQTNHLEIDKYRKTWSSKNKICQFNTGA